MLTFGIQNLCGGIEGIYFGTNGFQLFLNTAQIAQ